MNTFKWAEPQTVEQAAALLSKAGGKAVLMAGGTDLLGELKEGVVEPEVVIDLKSIFGLSYIKKEKDGLHIGAATPIAELIDSPVIRQEYKGLHEAARVIASPQLRNIGTVGGNLCQRPRCWYYRDAAAVCRKKGGSLCFASQGRNKYHAIIGGGVCFMVYPSDLAPMLIALGAEATITGPKGDRKLPLAQFYAPPLVNVQKENVLGPDDILRQVRIPPAKKGDKSAYLKFKERGAWDFALVSAGVRGNVSGKSVDDLAIVMGGVAPFPWKAEKMEKALRGKRLTETVVAQAAQAALEEARPLEDNAYKKDLAVAVLTRAVLSLVEKPA
jgi:xanthine dehydrogenase YagS FAD-binding subunit